MAKQIYVVNENEFLDFPSQEDAIIELCHKGRAEKLELEFTKEKAVMLDSEGNAIYEVYFDAIEIEHNKVVVHFGIGTVLEQLEQENFDLRYTDNQQMFLSYNGGEKFYTIEHAYQYATHNIKKRMSFYLETDEEIIQEYQEM